MHHNSDVLEASYILLQETNTRSVAYISKRKKKKKKENVSIVRTNTLVTSFFLDFDFTENRYKRK